MALKRGLDQMSAWLLAVVSTGAVFGVGYGISRLMARHYNDAEELETVEAEKAEPEAEKPKAEDEHEKAEPEKKEERHEEKKAESHETAEEKPHTGGSAPTREGPRPELTHWSYGGSEGPAHWASLSDDYKTCGTGLHQSPIDVGNFLDDHKLLPLRFDYHPTELTLRNDGRIVVADMKRGSELDYDARRYRLVRIDFHSPSEHYVEGVPYDFEAELVHEDPEGRTLILSVFFQQGDFNARNKGLTELWANLPKTGGEPEPLQLDPAKLLPPHRIYYTYEGSLTKPPCTEGVRWVLMREPLGISEKQVEVYMAAIDRSAGKPVRPIQKLNGRRVLRAAR